MMYALASRLEQIGRTVICTTTTRIFPPSLSESPKIYFLGDKLSGLKEIRGNIHHLRHLTVGRKIDPVTGKVLGISTEQVSSLTRIADHVIIEADGAAGRPIKAPGSHEPVIPNSASLVIPVIGLDALSRAANSINVFRLENFLKITYSLPGEKIKPHHIGLLAKHPEGLLRNVPASSTVKVFLNKIDCIDDHGLVIESSRQILENTSINLKYVVAGALRDNEGCFARFKR